MIKYVFQGFLFGLAYAAPIGMQNLYLINTAISMSKLRVYYTALVIIFFDITLALACFFGVGVFLSKFSLIKNIVLFIGCISIIYIGVGLIKAKPATTNNVRVNDSWIKVISICFAVTWLNPQAIIDGTLLLGGIKASLPEAASSYFILGTALASFSWFSCLSLLVSKFKTVLSDKIIKAINIICGIILVIYGVKLGISILSIIFSS